MYLWRHAPMISSPPKDRLNYFLKEEKEEVYEKAIFLLENDTYLYISYNGLLDNANTGITDIEEVETYEEALEIFNGY